MAEHYGLTRQAQAEQLLAWQYDTLTATYFLLLARQGWKNPPKKTH
jgi:hypothetical protein